MVTDMGITVASFILAYYVRKEILGSRFGLIELEPLSNYLWLLLIFIPLWWLLFNFHGLYESQRLNNTLGILWTLGKSFFWGGLIIAAMFYIFKLYLLSRFFIGLFILINASLLIFTKIFVKLFLQSARRKGYNYRTVLIAGKPDKVAQIKDRIEQRPDWGFKIVGYVIPDGVDNVGMVGTSLKHALAKPAPTGDTDSPGEQGTEGEQGGHVGAAQGGRKAPLGTFADIADLLSQYVIDIVFLAADLETLPNATEVIKACEEQGVRTCLIADFYNSPIATLSVEDLDGLPMLTYSVTPQDVGRLFVKRVLDCAVVLFFLPIVIPMFILIALAIKLTSRGSVLFKQKRVGLNGRIFTFYKFRTMVKDAEKMQNLVALFNEMSGPVFKARRDPRITWVGKYLRRASLDELPQLWNVLKGDMSLVGPRPPMPREVSQYEKWQRRRLSMRPGLTCFWQVSGRSDIDFDEWMRLDLQYIDNWSLKQDLTLLLRTIPAVLIGKGAR